jgi:hypothetical protein
VRRKTRATSRNTGLRWLFSSIRLFSFQGGWAYSSGAPPFQVWCTRKSRSAQWIEPFTNGFEAWMARWSSTHLRWNSKVPFWSSGPERVASAPNSVIMSGRSGFAACSPSR